MGYAVGSRCLDSLADAAQLYFSAVPPQLTDGGYQAFQLVGDQWHVNTYSTGSGDPVLSSSVLAVHAFPACDNGQALQDGLALGWLTVAPMLAVIGLLYLRKTFL